MSALVALMAAALAGAPDAPTAAQPAAPAAAPAAAAASAPAAPAAKKKDPLDEVICHRIEVTGSRLGATRVCHTRRDWMDINREAQTDVESVQRRGLMVRTPGS